MALYLGIDSGTQSTKAVLFDAENSICLAEARAPHSMVGGLPPGHMEQDPAVWINALETTVASVLQGVDDRSRITGIGVSGQQHGYVPLDGKGDVIRPAKLWCDTSTSEECTILTEALGGEEVVLERIGNRFLPGYTAPKILWMKRHEPEHHARLRHILLPHDYLNYFLTGHYCMEYGDASGTALLDIRLRQWSETVLQAIDPSIMEYLPVPSSSLGMAGLLREELANKWGLSKDVVVSAGSGDNMMGALGTGNIRPGILTASFGTSGTIYAYSSAPVVDPHGEIAAFCDATDGYLPLLCTMNVTAVTNQFRELLGVGFEEMENLLTATPCGADGLLLLPYFDGERTPSVPMGTGCFLGMRNKTVSRGHFLRAAIEGVTLGMAYGLNRLRTLGCEAREIRITGGGARSPGWRQVMADIFGVPVVAMQQDEGAALGAALHAARCTALVSGTPLDFASLVESAAVVKEETRTLPNRENHAVYCGLQEIQDEFSSILRSLFEKHRSLVGRLSGSGQTQQ